MTIGRALIAIAVIGTTAWVVAHHGTTSETVSPVVAKSDPTVKPLSDGTSNVAHSDARLVSRPAPTLPTTRYEAPPSVPVALPPSILVPVPDGMRSEDVVVQPNGVPALLRSRETRIDANDAQIAFRGTLPEGRLPEDFVVAPGGLPVAIRSTPETQSASRPESGQHILPDGLNPETHVVGRGGLPVSVGSAPTDASGMLPR